MNLRFALLSVLISTPLCIRPASAQSTAAPHSVDPANTQVSVDILSDRGGVDLSPYLQHLVDALNRRWRPLLKEAASTPVSGQQETVIGVTILSDGHLGAMKLVSSSHNDVLDKAAWTATGQDTYEPPPSLRDSPLRLRLNFIVN